MPVRSYTSADIVLTERRRLELPLFFLIWVGAASFSLAEGNMFYLLSCSLAVGVNWLAVYQNKEIYIRRIFVNIGVGMALIVIVLEFHLSDNSMPVVTAGHFIMLILLLKLFEQKRSRDYVQLLALNMLLMVSAALLTPAMWFPPVLVLYMALGCYVAMVFTLKRGLDSVGSATLRGEHRPLSPRQVAWNVVRDWPEKTLRRMVWVILIPSMILAGFAFITMPRKANQLAEAISKPLHSTGLESSIRLGVQKELYLSSRVVMRVRVLHGAHSSTAPGGDARYLRGYVLNQYKNSTWRNLAGHDRFILSPRQLSAKDEDLARGMTRHEIETVPLGKSSMVAPYPTIRLRGPGRGIVSLSSDLEYALSGSFRPADRIQYQTGSFARPFTARQLDFLKEIHSHGGLAKIKHPARCVELPARAEKRIRKLAAEWCGDLLAQRPRQGDKRDELNLAIARRLSKKLQAEHRYSLDLTASNPERDGVEDFLFYLRSGHCEYFASALAVMCCLMDVPARVATGFVMDQYDHEAGEYIVREQDAHAWCEVYSDREDWVIIDPTPAADRFQAMKKGWWGSVRGFFEEVRFFWYQKVVGYDISSRRELGQQVADWLAGLWNSLKRSFMNLLTRGVVDRILVRLMLLLQALTAGVLLLFLYRRLSRRRRKPAVPRPQRRAMLLERFLAMLERRGLEYQPHQTLRQRARVAGREFSLPIERLVEMAELQYRWRWGQNEPTTQELRRTRENFEILCEMLNTRAYNHTASQAPRPKSIVKPVKTG